MVEGSSFVKKRLMLLEKYFFFKKKRNLYLLKQKREWGNWLPHSLVFTTRYRINMLKEIGSKEKCNKRLLHFFGFLDIGEITLSSHLLYARYVRLWRSGEFISRIYSV